MSTLDTDELIKLIRGRMRFGQSMDEIAKFLSHMPQHEVYFAYVAASILEKAAKDNT